MSFPAPIHLGLNPSKFPDWRQHQPSAVLAITDTDKRFVGCVLPTGAGKSATVVGAALMTGWRTCVLTSTKLLADQYTSDMHDAGMVDIRGQGSYQCLAFEDEHWRLRDRPWHGCDEGPCHAGHPCSRKPERDEIGNALTGCTYYDAYTRAMHADLLVTNYKYWLSVHEFGPGLGKFDCLVLDEAHHAPNELGDFLSTTLDPADFELLGTGGPGVSDPRKWADWAKLQFSRTQKVMAILPRSRAEFRHHAHLRRVSQKLATLREMTEAKAWLCREHGDSWAFHPIWVSALAEKVLFRAIPHVVCTSATFTRKTAEMLGISTDALHWHEAPSDFPADRRPVYYVPCVKVDYRADQSQIRLWLATIDNILRTRRDRKGIIHAVSYERAKLIAQYSEFSTAMILHERTNTRERVAEFRAAGPGAILVSPCVTTGYDFPGASCEYQIVVKVPFPDKREPVTHARTLADKEYPAYIAMQELVQAVGRGMRSREDQCETVITDTNCGWFMQRYRHLAPTWFLDSYRECTTIPDPLPALT